MREWGKEEENNFSHPVSFFQLKYKKVYMDPTVHRIAEWQDANGGELNFRTADETSFGYLQQDWTIPLINEIQYEVRLKSTCASEERSPDSTKWYFSDSLFGVVDREPPSVFGSPAPLVNLQPGQELKIEFTEVRTPATDELLAAVAVSLIAALSKLLGIGL